MVINKWVCLAWIGLLILTLNSVAFELLTHLCFCFLPCKIRIIHLLPRAIMRTRQG